MTHRLTLCLLLLVFLSSLSAKSTLFRNGQSEYVISLPASASVPERTAAAELQQYLLQISGTKLPIIIGNRTADKAIIITTEAVGQGIDEDAFTYGSNGTHIYIKGGSSRGTMYGVYAFLENEFGVRWYTADHTVVPQRSEWTFDAFSRYEKPAVRYRMVQYYHVDTDPAWCAHNRNNTLWQTTHNKYGGTEAYWNAHTMTQFIAPDKYFKIHPEYFSMRNGKRLKNGQLCLTNKDVLRICSEKLLKAIEKHPDYFAYSLSQADNEDYCQCQSCTKIAQQYGAQSGLMLWFVNQVADVVAQRYPEKYVGTFAYRYTRKAPKGIRPRNNVIIRLCSIECCFGHPLTASCNRDFMNDLHDWGQIAPQIYIWDYVVNFKQYIAPFPNFNVLASNIKTFRDNRAIGIHEEAQYETNGGEWAELRAWVLAKLLWNPEQDAHALVREFIQAYYGKAADDVQKYFDMVQALVTNDHHFNIYINENNALYTEAFIKKGQKLLNKARRKVAGNAQLAHRVDKVRLQLLYLHAMRHTRKASNDGTLDELLTLIRQGNYQPGERYMVEQFTDNIKGRLR